MIDAEEDISINDAKSSNNDTKHSNSTIKDTDAKDSSTIKHVSQGPCSGNSVGSSTMVNSVTKNSINSDTKNNFDAKNPKNRPDIEEQMKLLLSTDSIIRVSSFIAKAKPHIHERCTKADGLSISDAYKVSYSHESAPNEVWMYKRKDVKYDIQKSWISLESLFSGGKIDIELSNDDDATINITPDGDESSGGSPPKTPLSIADTPRHAYNLRSSAGNTPSTSNSGVMHNSTYNLRPRGGRPVMPDCLREDDSISAMLERGTINRDFALSMQALGFGDEPLTYKEARLSPDSLEWATAEDVEWEALNRYNTFTWIGPGMNRSHKATPAWYLALECSPTRIHRNRAQEGKLCGRGLSLN